jgi:hypothetical protein
MSSLHGASTTSMCAATESPESNSTEIITDQTTNTADTVQHTVHSTPGTHQFVRSSKHFDLAEPSAERTINISGNYSYEVR